jgi:hypothetical protein
MNPSSQLIEQIRNGVAPRNVKEFAAQGVLPIPQDELVPLQVFLAKDQDEGISKTARASLLKAPEETWQRLVERKDPDPDVIAFCIQQASFPISIKEKILLNYSVPDDIVRFMASAESGPILDLIISNHVRLLRDPQLLSTLEQNKSLTNDQKRRVSEFRTEFITKKQKQAEADRLEETSYDDLLAQIPELDAEAQRIILAADQVEEEAPSEEEVRQNLQKLIPLEELATLPPELLSTYQRLLRMTMKQKLRCALLGGKEERGILIRDPHREIGSMVLRNPKLSDMEMENFAGMRDLDSDLLRQMGNSRLFLRKYSTILTLVKNPKTPSAVSLNLLKLVREADLKYLERDKNIPEVIRRQSKKTREMKQLRERK